MAGTHKILDFWRTLIEDSDPTGMPGDLVESPGIFVRVEQFAGQGTSHVVFIPFADYPGLEAEWELGEQTTVFRAAIEDYLTTFAWPEEAKTPAQRLLLDVQIAIE